MNCQNGSENVYGTVRQSDSRTVRRSDSQTDNRNVYELLELFGKRFSKCQNGSENVSVRHFAGVRIGNHNHQLWKAFGSAGELISRLLKRFEFPLFRYGMGT